MASAAQLARITDSGIEGIHLVQRSAEPAPKCQFEEKVEELGLEGQTFAQLASARSYKHIALRLWCRKHVHTRYVPSELIKAWGIEEWLT